MMKTVKNMAVSVSICAVVTLLLALTNAFTAPLITQNQNDAANAAFRDVMPDGNKFDAVDLSTVTVPATVSAAYKETGGLGYVIKLTTSGYASDMVILCGISTDGIIRGVVCLSSNETLGKEKTYGENFTGLDASGVDAVDTVSGATKTTESYKNAVKDALNTVTILGGGSVDIRTEEEVLADNLATALPAGEGAFTKWFITEALDGVDAVYVADNNSGYVCVIGDEFIGVDANGTIVTDSTANTAAVNDAIDKLRASTLEDIDLSAHPDLEATVVSAQKTASGTYVLETKGAGYGIKGGNEYHPASNEYIVVRVAIGADGTILDCVTVFEAETDGLGDACASESFYGQFDGKTETDYTDIDGISGATLTTDGYKQAIQRAFDARHVLQNGGEGDA